MSQPKQSVKFYERDGQPLPEAVLLCLGLYQYFNCNLTDVAALLRLRKTKRPGSRRAWDAVAVAQVISDHAGTCIVKYKLTPKRRQPCRNRTST